jgi:hypothetical protein
VVWSGSECLERYEALRRQALELGDRNCPADLEVAFIESQGLAAWIVAGPPGPSHTLIMPEEPLPKLPDSQSPPQDLVLALVDLILGDRSGGAK